MSSCSWAKHRYQWVKAHLPIPANKAARDASLVRIQPTRAQQAEARQLLRSLQPQQQEEPPAPSREQTYTQQLMLPEATAASPQAPTATQQPVATPQQATVYPTPQQGPFSPSAAVANPYANTRFVPRNTSGMEFQENPEPTPTEPDAAQLRGLRSPALPQALPMDIDGKLRTPSHL